MTLLADLKVFPLSEIIRQGKPRLAENLLTLRKNASVVNIQMHCSSHIACVETYPHFGVWVIHYVKEALQSPLQYMQMVELLGL